MPSAKITSCKPLSSTDPLGAHLDYFRIVGNPSLTRIKDELPVIPNQQPAAWSSHQRQQASRFVITASRSESGVEVQGWRFWWTVRNPETGIGELISSRLSANSVPP
jgi:hypothetical protein